MTEKNSDKMNGTDKMNFVLSNSDLLAIIFIYAASSMKKVSVIARTCKLWNYVLNSYGNASCRIWKSLCLAIDPDVVDIYDLCIGSRLSFNEGGGGWKFILKSRFTSVFQPIGSNKRLQKNFETVFRDEGIVAFSNCCSNCTDSYQNIPGFVLRERGIKFFKLFLNGVNYDNHFLDGVFVVYSDLNYVLKNWNNECDIIRRWCRVLGLREGFYTVKKPRSELECIFVEFSTILELENDDAVLAKEVEDNLHSQVVDWAPSLGFSLDLIGIGGYC